MPHARNQVGRELTRHVGGPRIGDDHRGTGVVDDVDDLIEREVGVHRGEVATDLTRAPGHLVEVRIVGHEDRDDLALGEPDRAEVAGELVRTLVQLLRT